MIDKYNSLMIQLFCQIIQLNFLSKSRHAIFISLDKNAMLLLSMFDFDDVLDCLATTELAFFWRTAWLYAIFYRRIYIMSFIALKCPSCGADIRLDSTKEFGFCQYCGTKVMQDKIVVEHRGSVRIDTSEELKNLYVLARRAKESNDTLNAQKYYEQIVVKDPKNWEASFYSIYYQATNCVIANIASAAINVSNNLNATFQLVKNYINDSDEQRKIIGEIVCKIMELSAALIEGATNHFNSIDPGIRKQYLQELNQRKSACINLCYDCGNYIESIFGESYIDLALTAWKYGVVQSGNQTKSNPYCKKIKQYDPEYKIKKSNFVKFGLPVIWFLILCVLYAECGKTWGLVYFLVSLLALAGYIVWKIVKKKKSKQ